MGRLKTAICLCLYLAWSEPVEARPQSLGPGGPGSGHIERETGLGQDLPEQVVSALVSLAGPSVAATYAELAAADPVGLLLDELDTDAPSATTAGLVRLRAERMAEHLAVADRAVSQAQAPVVTAATALGIRVVSQYTASANGLLVHATPSQLAALMALPQVVRIEPAVKARPSLSQGVPWIGASRIAAELGYDGDGTVVAVMDTGIDYTHAALGGPGTREAYQSAVLAPDVITNTWQGVPLFPNDKVVGGWDFVGQRYNTPELCPPSQAATGVCTSTPEPDPDPLDMHSHGTHVAGIVAGLGTPDGVVHSGVAPKAKLVALKIYGSPPGAIDEEVDVVVDAIDWCVRVNLGLEAPGSLPEKVDVINMSLGENFAQGSRLFEEVVDAANAAGIVVVASAGNAGNRPYVVGAPSASPRILSVASSTRPQESLQVEFSWAGGSRVENASEGSATVPMAQIGVLEADLAWFGRGCNDDERPQDVRERIALVERGDCTFVEKIANVQSAEAIGIVMFTNDSPRAGLAGSRDGVLIPGVMIDRAPGLDLVELLTTGTAVSVKLDPGRFGVDDSLADAVSGFSSRGPSKNGALKPDITAPGTEIVSAAYGTGAGGVAFSGTSMSGPFAAGAAALMQHRNFAEGLGLGAGQVAALLMNYSLPKITAGVGGPAVGVARQGAGRVDLVRSAEGRAVVTAGDIASLNVGARAISLPIRYSLPFTVTNLSDEPLAFRAVPTFLRQGPTGAVSVEGPRQLDVPAGASVRAEAGFMVDPANLAPWPFRTAANLSAAQLDGVEIDGHLELQGVDGAGRTVPGLTNPGLPFRLLARPASRVATRGVVDGDSPSVVFSNTSAFEGRVELFVLGGEDPHQADILHELDVRFVGARFAAPTAEYTRTQLAFAVTRWEPAAIPQVTAVNVYVDTDGDGLADFRLRGGTQQAVTGGGSGDAMVVAVQAWDSDTGAVVGQPTAVVPWRVDIHTRLTVLTVPMVALDLVAPVPIEYVVEVEGLNEDWLHAPNVDRVPKSGSPGRGPLGGFKYDPGLGRSRWTPAVWSVAVPGRDAQAIGVTVGTGEAPLLALYPDNTFEHPEAQAAIVEAAVPGPEPVPAFIPAAYRTFPAKRAGANEAVRGGITALGGVDRFRMVYDVSGSRDPAAGAQRSYAFDSNLGFELIVRPKQPGPRDSFAYVRWLDRVWYEDDRGQWRCGRLEWFMFLKHELVARLDQQFPRAGWREAGHAWNDPNLRQYVAEDPARNLTFLAQVPEGGGPAVVLSVTEGPVSDYLERHVYSFRDFGDPSIDTGPVRGVPCP